MSKNSEYASVKVSDVVQEMEVPSDTITVYLNKRTGEFVPVSEEDEMFVESDRGDEVLPEWQQDIMPKIREALESEDYIALPDQFEIHEWEIMRDFSTSVEDQEISDRLMDAIHGPGAFRYFKDQIRVFGIEDEWYRFRGKALEGIAIDWLEANDIPYYSSVGDA
jgi:hypothetical protein